MVDIQTISGALPKPELKKQDYRKFADTGDIIRAIMWQDANSTEQGKMIAKYFAASTADQTAANIANFLRQNVKYSADKPSAQVIKSPAALLKTGVGDCKSFAVFTRVVMNGAGYKCGYRFAQYAGKSDFSHVYNVFGSEKKKIVDATLPAGTPEAPAIKIKDIMPTNVYTMNGAAPDAANVNRLVTNPVSSGPNRLTYEYAVQTGDYLPYLEAYNQFYQNWFNPAIERFLKNRDASKAMKNTVSSVYYVWLARMWEDREFARTMAIAINNQMYANARAARGMWSNVDQQATVAQHPRFVEYAKMFGLYINQCRLVFGAANLMNQAEATEALKAFIFLANFNHGNYENMKTRFNGSAAIGEPVTATVIISLVVAILGTTKAIAEAVKAWKGDMEKAGIDVDKLFQNAANEWNKRQQQQQPGAPGGSTPGGGGPGGGGSPGSAPSWLLPAAAVAVGFFLFNK